MLYGSLSFIDDYDPLSFSESCEETKDVFLFLFLYDSRHHFSIFPFFILMDGSHFMTDGIVLRRKMKLK